MWTSCPKIIGGAKLEILEWFFSKNHSNISSFAKNVFAKDDPALENKIEWNGMGSGEWNI